MVARYGTFESALAERYRFEEELGHGAMGTVYRAFDVRLERPVAIKVLHATLTNELGAARFQSEIRIAANLHHPHIVAVHESGEVDGQLFYVMDYLGGETLRDQLQREKQLSVADALWITTQVADGLQHAHNHGVVHRDVKPENIIIAEGRAYIVDFGLARALGNVKAQRLTASGLSVGTPHYLSPEQASAEKDVGPKADQYALACVLYEMLVGEPPFSGATASAVALRHITEEPPALRTRRRAAPRSVEAAVLRAMEKVPADRFSSVVEFAASASDAPVRESHTPPSARVVASIEASERVIASRGYRRAGVLLAALLSAGGVGTWMLSRRETTSPAPVMQAGIQLAIVPVIEKGGDGVPQRPLVDAVSEGVRQIGAMLSVTLPPITVQELGAPPYTTRLSSVAQAAGAQYAAAIDATRATAVRVDVLDVRSGQSIASEGFRATSEAVTADVGADIAVSIARSISAHDSLFAPAYRTLLRSTRSARALGHLVEGQRRFGAGDVDRAREEYRRAYEADSMCMLALHRLSTIAWGDMQYAEALSLANAGLRRAAVAGDARMSHLLRAQRYLSLRQSDSAIAEFRAAVADDPDNIDGWYGLAQAMYFGGWIVGYTIRDARGAYDQVMRLDSSFAQFHGELVEVALAAGDTTMARRAVRPISRAVPWRRAKEIAVAYAVARDAQREAILARLDDENRYTLSELVLHFSRTMDDPSAADRAARALLGESRPPGDKARGLEYRLALAPALNREAGAIADVARARLDTAFDPWFAVASMSGVMASHRAPQRQMASRILPARLVERELLDPLSVTGQALEFLVQDALDEQSGARAAALATALKDVNVASDSANPALLNWRQSLQARASLSRGDTARAIALLKRVMVRINSPYVAFQPLASLPMQRQLLRDLLRATKAPDAEVSVVTTSFRRSWSVADALFDETKQPRR